jgi:hypothetical protein
MRSKSSLTVLAGALFIFCGTDATITMAKDNGAPVATVKGTPPMSPAASKKTMKPMLDSSKQTCKTTSESLDKLLVVFTEAKDSGDKDRMRAALVQAENHILAMKADMSQCMNMMDMMGGMLAEKAPKGPGLAKDGSAKSHDRADGLSDGAGPVR